MTTANLKISLSLEKRVAIVTGAAQNIGRAIAKGLAQAGAYVVVADLQPAKASRVAQEIEQLGGRALAVETDIRDESQIDKMVRLTADKFGRIDILVNNAGIVSGVRIPMETINPAMWENYQAVCLKGAFFASQAVVPFMRKRRKGKIINISSVVFWLGNTNCLAYISAKGGLIGLTRGLARELGPYNINVNAVTPGAVKTVMKNRANQKTVDAIVSSQCLTRRVLPEDIANAVLFLASDLSDAITGQTINVDSGWAMH